MADIIVSAETLDELRQVLARDRLNAFRDQEARQAFFAHCEAMTVLLAVTETVVACRDPKDEKFLSLALRAGASLLVSSDDDLLTLGRFGNTTILRPEHFVDFCEA